MILALFQDDNSVDNVDKLNVHNSWKIYFIRENQIGFVVGFIY